MNDITIDINNIENYTIELTEQGPQGIAGPPGADGPQGEQGEPGANGVGIRSIEKTSTSGLVDTYTITYTDNVTQTYQVTNGKDAELNGYNVLTIYATDGISLTQEEDELTISGGSILSDITNIEDDIDDIEALIPAQASSLNQLADKSFVNSSIATNTANFIGTFSDVATLEAYSGTVTNNDYAFVVNSVVEDNGNDWASFSDLDDYDKDLLTNFDYAWVVNGSNFDLYRFNIVEQEWGLRVSDTPKAAVTLNTAYNRYKATVSGSTTTWSWEYTLNNSSFTASQWAAINSGATTTNIGQITTNTNAIGNLASLTTTDKTDLVSALNELNSSKQDAVTFSTGLTNTSGTITVTDYNKLVKNLSVTNDDFIVGGATGSGTSGRYEVAIGNGSSTNGQETVAIGHGALAQANGAIVIGASSTTGQNTIILGKGTTSTSNIFAVGFGSNGTYTMLDGTTGLIPDERISSNIARTSALSSKQDTLVSGTNIKTINSTSLLGSGDIDTKSLAVTALSGTSITLTDNSINTLTPTGNTTFTLPTVSDTTIFHQILVQLNLSTVYTIGLGTTTYFGGTAPDLTATGNYNLIYEYDNALSSWVVGSIDKGA